MSLAHPRQRAVTTACADTGAGMVPAGLPTGGLGTPTAPRALPTTKSVPPVRLNTVLPFPRQLGRQPPPTASQTQTLRLGQAAPPTAGYVLQRGRAPGGSGFGRPHGPRRGAWGREGGGPSGDLLLVGGPPGGGGGAVTTGCPVAMSAWMAAPQALGLTPSRVPRVHHVG